MRSRKNLKKDIHYTAHLLVMDALNLYSISNEKYYEQIMEIAQKGIQVETEFIKRVSHSDGKENQQRCRMYFKDLISKFTEEMNKLFDELEKIAKEN